MITVASHNGTANAIFIDSWVVGVKVYGSNPNILIVIRNKIREANNKAHLWPRMLTGSINWVVNQLINCVLAFVSRSFTHLGFGAGNSDHGRMIAKTISGIPSKIGLSNWSNRLTVMFNFRSR